MEKQTLISVAETQDRVCAQSIPVSAIPTPTNESRIRRKLQKLVQGSGTVTAMAPNTPAPIPAPPGCRTLIYRQDPSVQEAGLKKVYLPNYVADGPYDLRIKSEGSDMVYKNALGDMVQTPGTEAFNVVQAYTVVRMVLNMTQCALRAVNINNPIPWFWNTYPKAGESADIPLSVKAHGLPDVMNAYYTRAEKSLRFGYFVKPGSQGEKVYTCLSLDIVAHETAHAVLDGLKPNWITRSQIPQTSALHEAFGDLMAIFLTISQMDMADAIITQTKANLHDKTFLSDIAEEFGLCLGRSNGFRNADNDLKLSNVGVEVHDLSQVFTGAVYDILADMFAYDLSMQPRENPAKILHSRASYLFGLLLRSLMNAGDDDVTFFDIMKEMKSGCENDQMPEVYASYIEHRFTIREITEPLPGEIPHESAVAGTPQTRQYCCGTMKRDEYNTGADDPWAGERIELKNFLKTK